MADGLYTFVIGAFGVVFLVVGAGFLVEPGRERVRKAFGTLFLALGSVYMLSWFSDSWRLPLALDNLLVVAIVFAMSQSLFEMSLYLFGDEAVRGYRRTVYVCGAIWSAALWLLPFLDGAFGLPVIGVSVEDGRTMALFQAISSAALYIWPITITIVSLRAGRWHPADLPQEPGLAWTFIGSFAVLVVMLVVIAAAIATSMQSLYRAGHTALQLLMLSWYLYYRAHPDAFRRARGEIEQRHAQREVLSPEEIRAIAARLQQLIDSDSVHTHVELSLNALAKRLRLPAYKLSAYLNGTLGRSFPAWLNETRIEYVKKLLVEKPGSSILDLSMEAGYASKAVFNSQFRRLVGMSPREYREKNSRQK